MAETGRNGAIEWNRYGYKFGGRLYQRVTTIKAKKGGGSALIDWAARMVAEKAREIGEALRDGRLTAEEAAVRLMDERLAQAHNEARDSAADFGTVFHALVEDFAAGDQEVLHTTERRLDRIALLQLAARSGVQLKDERAERLYEQRLDAAGREELAAEREALKARLWPDVEAFLDWCDSFKPRWVRNEFQVFSDRMGVAGSVDALAEVGGRLALIDVKTSKAVYGDYSLQLAAYRHAEFIGEPDGSRTPMPSVDFCGVLHVRDGSCRLLELAAGPEELAAFEACLRLYWWDRGEKGRPMVEVPAPEPAGEPVLAGIDEEAFA